MKRSVISSLVLAGAMLVSTGAWAQTMVGQQSVSAEDLPKVEAQCASLVAAGNTSPASNSDVNPSTNNETTPQNEDPASSKSNDDPVGADQATAAIDLSTITLEDCKAAKLGGAM